MLWTVEFDVAGDTPALRAAPYRYRTLHRVNTAAAHERVVWLAFGFTDRVLRCLLEGPESAVSAVGRRVMVGTRNDARHRDAGTQLETTHRQRWPMDLEAGVVWCHLAVRIDGVDDVLASAWSSHRDLLGFRDAPFFDATPLRARVDPLQIHQRCGSDAVPSAPSEPAPTQDLPRLMRVAAAVHGVLPGDRDALVTFVHLALMGGTRNTEIAEKLRVSPRWVRRLASRDSDHLVPAVTSLVDPRLAAVP